MPANAPSHPSDVHSLWSTPVFVHRWPQGMRLAEELEAIIQAEHDANPGIARSNVGGWHSHDAFINQDLAPLRELRGLIDQAVSALNADMGIEFRSDTLRLEGWANINGPGDFNTPHVHRESIWSGVFYVRTCERKQGGAIAFLDPRAGSGNCVTPDAPFDTYRMLHPVTGLMVVFPSWLRHEVQPHRMDGVRITVPFNVRPH